MEIDEFLFKLLILSIPGSIVYLIFSKVAIFRRENKESFGFKEVFFILISSFVTNALYDFGSLIINHVCSKNIEYTLSRLINAGTYTTQEIFFLIFIALFLGFFLSAIETKKVLYKIVKKIGITTHYGDDDVWTFICNSPDIEWIYVRDLKYDLVYFGRLEQYSDPGELREILLSEVSVYKNKSGKYCYDTPKLYISRLPEEISIEILPKEE
jgi:hypothetical protein